MYSTTQYRKVLNLIKRNTQSTGKVTNCIIRGLIIFIIERYAKLYKAEPFLETKRMLTVFKTLPNG